MSPYVVVAVTACSILLTASAAVACPLPAACLPALVVFPAYTPEGHRIGPVGAPVRRLPRLEVSRLTGQPVTVVFNNPASVPGVIDPGLELMRLPRVPRSTTQAVYARGY